MLQDHLLKVNPIFFWQVVSEYTEGDVHPCSTARMKAQSPKLFCLSSVLRKGLCYAL